VQAVQTGPNVVNLVPADVHCVSWRRSSRRAYYASVLLDDTSSFDRSPLVDIVDRSQTV